MKYKQEGVLPSSEIYLHQPTDFAHRALFYVERAGDQQATTEWGIRRPFLNSFLLFYIREGELEFHEPERDFTAGPGSIVLFCCKGMHSYTARTLSDFSWFHFNGASAQDYYDLLTETGDAAVFRNAAYPVAVTLFEQIMRELRCDRINEHRTSALIASLLGELVMPGDGLRHIDDLTIQEAVSYMERHFAEDLSLEKISAHVNLSPYYFSRQFKKYTGSTPYEFLQTTRIQQAKKLLLSSRLSVESISVKCGFNSLSNFIRAFKKDVRLTPGKFRDMRF
ncbi:MAG: helix-turn-helix domain-containing protein [Intestinibacillus sp.]